MSVVYRKYIPLAITFLIGLLLLTTYFLELPSNVVNFANVLPNWGVILVSSALGVGIIRSWQIHTSYIIKRKEAQWPYSLVALGTFILFFGSGLIYGTNSPIFTWIYTNVLRPPYSTTYAIYFFFISSACFRMLRMKNKESFTLIVGAILIMLSNTALGELIWEGFPMVGTWIKTVPMMAVFRGMTISVAVGTIILGIRAILGLERGYSLGEGN